MQKKLFVFDLDFTIWDAGGTWCDATNPPYFKEKEDVYDSSGRCLRLYPDVRRILTLLKKSGKYMAVASRTFEPGWANDLLKLFQIDHFFDRKEIYPDSKVRHFRKIQEHFKLNYSEMVFFDDEYRNIEEVGRLGVESVFVKNGLDKDLIKPFL
ncbi:MAG: magnesium-dependent phosphatase-1 [Prolixibacteraceae bacterium]|nr:magnesium-dependent phosphatase-1 [Prolixibacteraceae bacterium]MBN2773709.1 magnesium-dependent phosphatase-1 [Prolixibacteraceae bacterium]